MRARFAALALPWLAAACGFGGRPLPATHHYTLVPPEAAPIDAEAPERRVVIAIDALEADAAYGDERIAYRTSPYRLDYYEYHRWPAIPALHVADYLQTALMRTGHFARVGRELADDAQVFLGGRIIAFDEVDLAEGRWLGRIELTLHLVDRRTGALLWSRHFREEAPLAERTPEALAQAFSLIMNRMVTRIAPEVAEVARSVGYAEE